MLSSTLAALTDDDLVGAAMIVVRAPEQEAAGAIAILKVRLGETSVVRLVPMSRDTEVLLITEDLLNQMGWHRG